VIPIIKNLVPSSKYNIKCPYKMTPEYITVHNTANNTSAKNEIQYMITNSNEVSFHFAVDDKEAVQGLPLDRNGWHAGDGNGDGNRKSIAIEICYSLNGGERFNKAETNAAILIANLLNKRNWNIDKVKKHEDWSNKNCPHRTIELGWDRFLNKIQLELNKLNGNNSNDITYQVWDDVTNNWLPNVVNDTDYAGIYGHDICLVYASLNKGNTYYKVHYKNGKWLPNVKNREDYAGIKNKPIDGFMIKTDTKKITYRVHLRRQNRWLSWVSGYNQNDKKNGYAGILGQEIDAIQIK